MEIYAPYSLFCKYYDEVLSYIDFPKWKNFILNEYLAQKKENPSTIVDLGCGTGSLLREFREISAQRFGMDISDEMLKIARKNHTEIIFFKGDLRNFHFNLKADLAICAHDSLNYLTNLIELKNHFDCMNSILKVGGLYFFDVTSEKNLLSNFHRKTTEEHLKDGRLIWTNEYFKKEKKIVSTLEFFTKKRNVKEIHVQKYFSPKEIINVLHKTGFTILRIGGDYESWEKYKDADLINFLVSVAK